MSSMHEPEDQLELYALDRLPQEAVERIEEHVMVCDHCRKRLEEIGEFALTMRTSIQAERLEPTIRKSGWLGGWSLRFALAGGLAFALIIGILYVRNQRIASLPPMASLTLAAVRGATTSAPRSQAFDLTLKDSAGPNQSVDIADETGKVVWKGAVVNKGADAAIRVDEALEPGGYFVRLHSASGQEIAEYGFTVR